MPEPRPVTHRTTALMALMGVNGAVHLLWSFGGEAWMGDHFIVSFDSAFHRPWTLLTAIFSHRDPVHLAFNLLALWVFGSPVERVMGPFRFTLLYLFGGLAGSAAYVLWAALTGTPVGALGASGAVMAVATVYGLWFPRRTLMINFILPVPAWLAVILFVAFDLFGMLGGGGRTAYAAHLGGAALGLLAALPRLVRGP